MGRVDPAQPPLNHADKRVLAALARNERRRPHQHIEVWFDETEEATEAGEDVGRYDDASDSSPAGGHRSS